MRATGIIRRVDELGRVVIPKEIRRQMRIKENDEMAIFIGEDGGIIFQPIPSGHDYARLTKLLTDCQSMEGYGEDLVNKQVDYLFENGLAFRYN